MNFATRMNFTTKMTTPSEKLKLMTEIIQDMTQIIQEMLTKLEALDERIDKIVTYCVILGCMMILIFQMLQWIDSRLPRRIEQ